MADPKIPLEADKYFHIYNHAVGKDNLFIIDKNYTFFLLNFKDYISPFADLAGYCLMPNHFHLIVRFHSFDEIVKVFLERKIIKDTNIDFEMLGELLSRQFSNFFNRYAKSVNK